MFRYVSWVVRRDFLLPVFDWDANESHGVEVIIEKQNMTILIFCTTWFLILYLNKYYVESVRVESVISYFFLAYACKVMTYQSIGNTYVCKLVKIFNN